MIIPFNYLGALGGFLKEELGQLRLTEPRSHSGPAPGAVAPSVGRGSSPSVVEPKRPLPASGKRMVVIFILGESARARSFSLNGYPRDTNPRLRRQGVISFSHVEACATATAQAIPCICSSLGEPDIARVNADIRAQRQEREQNSTRTQQPTALLKHCV